MSDDLIKREDAIRALRIEYPTMPMFKNLREEWAIKTEGFRKAEEVIMSVPSADRPQGEWKPFDLTWGRSIYACSVCEEAIAVPCGWSDGKPIYDYCPMCGARLKGADDDFCSYGKREGE